MLLALASLDLGGIFLSRSSKMSYVIEALAFALRTPERESL
jgi:hypothetical protein